MPAPEQWESYFDADGIVECLVGSHLKGDAVEFGCGYGTFTIAAAPRMEGMVYALDIDADMVTATAARVSQSNLHNVIVEQRDFVAAGSGRRSASMSMALLFNILHIESPVELLMEAHRILHRGGVVAVIHWRHDLPTPRGPPLDIRPRPEQCRAWSEEAGLRWVRDEALPGSPWHWGMVFVKP
jgi:SAM-dependent methyltransferase